VLTADGLQGLEIAAAQNPGVDVGQQPSLLHHHPTGFCHILLQLSLFQGISFPLSFPIRRKTKGHMLRFCEKSAKQKSMVAVKTHTSVLE
jgi:hypothetical protein